nr:ABC transporter substrate-binding protein [uncultured Anaerosporobacter sp.]
MINKKRIIFYILLVTCLAFIVGCSEKKSNEKSNVSSTNSTNENATNGSAEDKNKLNQNAQAMGRYIETPCGTIENGADMSKLTIMEDGTIVILDTLTGDLHTSRDEGETWETEEVRGIKSLLVKPNCEITSGAVNRNGDIFFSYIPWDEITDANDTDMERYVYIAKNGEEKELKLPVNNNSLRLLKAEFANDGVLYALTIGDEIIKINPDDESVETVFEGESYLNTFAIDGLYLVAEGEGVGYIYNTQTKELIMNDSVLNDFLKANVKGDQLCQLAANDKENAIYVACSEGVYRHVINGNVMEQLVSGELTNLGSPSNSATSFKVKEDGSFLIGYDSGELDSYSYNAEVPSVPSNQIRIYSLHENKTIQQAIVNYRKNNPDVFIKLEIGVTGDDAVTNTDAIQKLNTSVLAGDGPDLIVLDGLPMDSYIEKGVLYDLSEVMKEVEQSDTYFTNVTHAYQTENGLYGVPMKFQIPIIIGNEKEITKADSIEKLSQMIQDMRAGDNKTATIMGGYTPKEVLEHLEMGCGGAWLTKEGKMDEVKLNKYLTYAKAIYESELEDLTEDMISTQIAYRKEISEMLNGQMSKLLSITPQLSRMMFGDQQIVIGYVDGINDYQMLLATLNQDTSISYQRFDLQSGYNFIPKGIMGVNSASKDMETTLDFYKSLYSEKLQEADVMEGFPVNKTVFAKLAKGKNITESYIGSSDRNGKEISYHLTIPTDEEMKRLLELAEGLTTPALMDNTIQDTVETFGEKVLSGEISLDEGVKAIIQKVDLYLQE